MRFGRVVFVRRKIGCDLERKDSAIVIMPQDCVVRSADWTADQFCRRRDLPMREVERLGILKFQRSRKVDREIIAQLVLRERRAITIGNLAARSGDIENVSARVFEFRMLERFLHQLRAAMLPPRAWRWARQRMQVPAAAPLRWRIRKAAMSH